MLYVLIEIPSFVKALKLSKLVKEYWEYCKVLFWKPILLYISLISMPFAPVKYYLFSVHWSK